LTANIADESVSNPAQFGDLAIAQIPEFLQSDFDGLPLSACPAVRRRNGPSMIAPLVGREPPAGDPLPEDPDFLTAIGRLTQFFLEGKKLSQIGLRVLVAVHKLRPDLIGGISFQEISQMAGFGRSATHNLSESFETFFPVGKMRLDRSARARRAYARSHVKDGQGPGSGHLNHFTAGPPWSTQGAPSSQPRLKA
jgi:hypothetical protein